MSFNFGSLRINIKVSVFLILFFMIALNLSEQFFILIVCTSFHELCHILVARAFGLKCRKIEITPLGYNAEIIDMESITILKRLLIISVGVVFNFIVAFASNDSIIRGINIMLIILNILPVYPMDGGRVLYYLLCFKFGALNGNKLSMKVSRLVSYIIVILGFIQLVLYGYNISIFCIGVYFVKLNKNNYLKSSYKLYKAIFNKAENRILNIKFLSVGAEVSIKQLIYTLSWDYYVVFYIDNFVINQTELVNYITNSGINGTIQDVLLANQT